LSIAEEPGTRPGMIILNVGTFDEPTVAKAGREIFSRRRAAVGRGARRNSALCKTARLRSTSGDCAGPGEHGSDGQQAPICRDTKLPRRGLSRPIIEPRSSRRGNYEEA
jgi:hypothetical protein